MITRRKEVNRDLIEEKELGSWNRNNVRPSLLHGIDFGVLLLAKTFGRWQKIPGVQPNFKLGSAMAPRTATRESKGDSVLFRLCTGFLGRT